ncbi:MAG TPA: hypothetical protein VGL19_00040 [Polyangiaceae bacterium]|jgi:hypothetical protein
MPQELEPPKQVRYMTGAGFVVILLAAVLVGTLSDWLFHALVHTTRRTGWVGPLCAVSVFAYLAGADHTKRIRQLFADKL